MPLATLLAAALTAAAFTPGAATEVHAFEILPIHGRVIVRVDARDGTIASVTRPGDRR